MSKLKRVDFRNISQFANEIYVCLDWDKFEKRNPNKSETLNRMLLRFQRFYKDEMEKVEAYQDRGDLKCLRN